MILLNMKTLIKSKSAVKPPPVSWDNPLDITV
jgi:hypothetical protein